ncbi:hypothetical protein Tco_1399888 [Tanacetum coccineum]
MSSDNASATVTYTSISSDSNGLSWGIPLVNADELPEMDPYEEVTQQGQVPPLTPANVPNPMKLEEHVLVYVPEPEHPEYHLPSDDDMQVEDQPYADDASSTAESPRYIANSDSMKQDIDEDSINYPDEPEDGEEDDDEDPKEDPSEEHKPEDDDEDPKEDPNEEPSKGSDETEPFEEDETTVTPLPPGHLAVESPLFLLSPTSPSYDQAPLGHSVAMIHMRDDILEEDMPPQRIFALTAPPPGCDVAESSVVVVTRAPRGQYDFVDTVETGQGLIRSPGHDALTIARAAGRAEDVGYVRAL